MKKKPISNDRLAGEGSESFQEVKRNRNNYGTGLGQKIG
jgi:hypothetical protein